MSDAKPTAVALFAKAPIPGRVKTRLTPPLSSEDAAEVAGACLEDSIERFARGDVAMTLFLEGDADDPLLALAARRRVPIRRQDSGTLGTRLRAAMGALLEEGHPCAIAIGADSPTLPTDRIAAAVAALRAHDAVLGPTEDGGYYLIGFSRPAWALLEEIPWSTTDVARVTRERAARAGISLAELETWYDVDDMESLRRALAGSDPGSALGRWGSRIRT